MCRSAVKIVCFLLLVVAKNGFADVCDDKTPFGYGIYMTPKLDFKTAVKCCETYGMTYYDIRNPNERDMKILKHIVSSANNEHIFWTFYNDIVDEQRIVNADGNLLSLFENVILQPGNSEEKDCIAHTNAGEGVVEWVDCNSKHHLMCRDVEEYENAQI